MCKTIFCAGPLKNAVEIINSQNADVIFFTGDLVNDKSSEAEPYIETLSQLKAPHGVFSTFGNHDYGDYISWPSPKDKINNLENLKDIHARTGWKLLFDENTYLEKNNEESAY